jgi:type I restriction enzyme R subunit
LIKSLLNTILYKEKLDFMRPEEFARQKIDELLTLAGWSVQDYPRFSLSSNLGVAVREFPLENGYADYALFVDKKLVGLIEAKPEGTTLSGVAEQTERYSSSIPEKFHISEEEIRFLYESTGVETFFRDKKDPSPRSRRVFAFHRPETLKEWMNQPETLRSRLQKLPPLITEGLRDCQIEAIVNLEKSFAENRPRALIQMASGSGKTYTAVNFVYRLIKFANAKRILFLVDRNNLGRQTRKEFQQFITPDDRRKFTELYNIQHLTSNVIDPVSRVCITTIQRLYSMLKGETEFDENMEEQSFFEIYPQEVQLKEITYNPNIPIETFDFIITDECHRSIYNLWRQVLEYFDAFIIGLTATPSKQTLGFFNQNLVYEYTYEQSVADGVNVPYEVYRIKTEITEKGSSVQAGYYIDKRNKLTRKTRWELLDEDLEYDPSDLDRSVVALDQIRTIIRTFKEKLFTEIFPGRSEVPKTLIFAKDDSHAEDIVHIVREEFGKGNDFCKKITYRTTGEKPENLIQDFRNSYNPRIAVTVDMISTGTDIKPIECLIFMRDVKSRTYFEQMKGRGTRSINPTELQAVTPDVNNKTHFIIVDAVGVCESDKTDSRPLERKPSVKFETIITDIALGLRDEDTITSLANRLTRLEKQLDEKEKQEIEKIAGKSLREIVKDLFNAIDKDKQIEKAKEEFNTDEPTEEQLKSAFEKLADEVCKPFDNPDLRELLIEVKKKNEQIIDTISKDTVIFAGADPNAKEQAATIINKFKKFIEENKDEITALQIIYNQPYAKRYLTYEQIKQLVEAIQKPPYRINPEQVWLAYEQLEKSKVRGAGPQKLLTNIISLIRFTIGQTDTLQPFPETVDEKFHRWLKEQEEKGKRFTSEQLQWLEMIKDHIASSLAINKDDFELSPFYEEGGLIKAYQIFGNQLEEILNELNEVLVA